MVHKEKTHKNTSSELLRNGAIKKCFSREESKTIAARNETGTNQSAYLPIQVPPLYQPFQRRESVTPINGKGTMTIIQMHVFILLQNKLLSVGSALRRRGKRNRNDFAAMVVAIINKRGVKVRIVFWADLTERMLSMRHLLQFEGYSFQKVVLFSK